MVPGRCLCFIILCLGEKINGDSPQLQVGPWSMELVVKLISYYCIFILSIYSNFIRNKSIHTIIFYLIQKDKIYNTQIIFGILFWD